MSDVLDVLGVGFGPSNLALAISFEERGFKGSRLFLERNANDQWQEELMLAGADVQHHFLRDLITPVNPRSRFGFLTYLQDQGRLFDFLNLPSRYAFRSDYAKYVRWAAAQFSHEVRHGVDITEIDLSVGSEGPVFSARTSRGRTYHARSLVLAPGRTPRVPPLFANSLGTRIFHSSRYLSSLKPLADRGCPGRIAVIGSSQSAVEILLDLHSRFPSCEVVSISRSYGVQTKDTSPFTHHVYLPAFIDEYFDAPTSMRGRLWDELKRTNYCAADEDVVNELYCRRYEDHVRGTPRLSMKNCRDVTGLSEHDSTVTLTLEDRLGREPSKEEHFDAVILATGFRNLGPGSESEQVPPLLTRVAHLFERSPCGTVAVQRDYSLKAAELTTPPTFLNGLCESTHGFGDAGSFSLVSVRADAIADAVDKHLFGPGRLARVSTIVSSVPAEPKSTAYGT